MIKTDLVVIGAGLVGLATAYQAKRSFPSLRIAILEKESDVAQHQSGRNSGVLHSGIYYKPGSEKARNCIKGKALMQEFCDQHSIPYRLCGKVIVATEQEELSRLEKIYERGQENKVACKLMTIGELKEVEPHVAGIGAIRVPDCGVIDFRQVAIKLREHLLAQGIEFKFGQKVQRISLGRKSALVGTDNCELECSYILNCAGLYSDKILRLCGEDIGVRIIPFRGEYFLLQSEASQLCRSLIYPVPDPKFPFLGVHLTRDIHDQVECGPNAVLALAREGYGKLTIHPGEFAEVLLYPGFLKFALKHLSAGFHEFYRSLCKSAFVSALKRLVPDIRGEFLTPAASGVRAQAINREGVLLDDFVLHQTKRSLHVVNAPSPAATSCFSIAERLVQMASPYW